jgi:hypothetical protein
MSSDFKSQGKANSGVVKQNALHMQSFDDLVHEIPRLKEVAPPAEQKHEPM